MTPARTFPVLFLLLNSSLASAGSFLDYIRSYDLNDYALGLAVSVSESPFVGGDNSTIAYPYLTSFRDSAFTDDWFLVSQGDLGLRWVNDAGWELGAVGRLQTLGLGNSGDPVLRGLADRNWAIEVAPMVGFRRWPVHVNLKTYFEILGRHGGTETNLALLWPWEFDRGWLIPSVEAIHRSADYANYYFGVTPDEARPSRPEYTPGSSTGAAARLRWGWELTDKWLLSGSLGLEFLGSEITDSPIVEKDRTWSANIGLAYNSDIFQPRVSEVGGKRQPRFEIRGIGFSVSADSRVIREDDDGDEGDEIDLEDTLGVSDSENVFQFEAILRLNSFHRLELGYHRMTRTGTTLLDGDTKFGNTVFASDTEIATTFESELLRFSYGYSLMNDEQKELGVMAGVHVANSITDILSVSTGARERQDVSTPLPVVGVFGSVELGWQSSLGARIQAFGMEFDRLEGLMLFLNLEWQRRFGEHLSAGIGYNYYYTNLESRDVDARGTLETHHHGPTITFTAGF